MANKKTNAPKKIVLKSNESGIPLDDKGNPLFTYKKLTYWINGVRNWKYDIFGALMYKGMEVRPTELDGEPIPVGSYFHDWTPGGNTYIMTNHGWEVYSEGGGGGGEPANYLRNMIIDITSQADKKYFVITSNLDIEQKFGIAAGDGVSFQMTDDGLIQINAQGGGSGGSGYSRIEKLEDYLYEIWYDVLDDKYAKEFFEKKKIPVYGKNANKTLHRGVGACSAIIKGSWYGRNFDWLFNEGAGFVCHTQEKDGRYATLGVSGSINELTEAFVSSGEDSEVYKIVPYMIADGINSQGLTVSTLVVPNEQGDCSVINPQGVVKKEICTLMIPRYILDNYDDAKYAVYEMQENIKLFHPKLLLDMGYNQHFLISDKNKNAFLLEFKEGKYVIRDVRENERYVTNFYLNDVILNADGTVYTPETKDSRHSAHTTNLISPGGSGLERFNILAQRLPLISNIEDVKSLMTDLNYTRSYDSSKFPPVNPWLTEFTDGVNLTVDSNPNEFTSVREEAAVRFSNRSRDPQSEFYGTWQTVHSAVYDMDTLELFVTSQENGVWRGFKLGTQGDFATKQFVLDEDNKTLSAANAFSSKLGDTKVDKLLMGNVVYATDGLGNLLAVPYAPGVESGAIIRRDEAGRVLVPEVDESTGYGHAVNKGYIDQIVKAVTAEINNIYDAMRPQKGDIIFNSQYDTVEKVIARYGQGNWTLRTDLPDYAWELDKETPHVQMEIEYKAYGGTINGKEHYTEKSLTNTDIKMSLAGTHKFAYPFTSQDFKNKVLIIGDSGKPVTVVIDEKSQQVTFNTGENKKVTVTYFATDTLFLEMPEKLGQLPTINESSLDKFDLLASEPANIENRVMAIASINDGEKFIDLQLNEVETYGYPSKVTFPSELAGCSYEGNGLFRFIEGNNSSYNTHILVEYEEQPTPTQDEFKAVLDSDGVLTFYYDGIEHEGTTYSQSQIPTAASGGSDWPWYKESHNIKEVRSDVSALKYDLLTSFRAMFVNCQAKNYDLSNLNGHNVTTLRSMFEDSWVSQVVFPEFKAPITSLTFMFYECVQLQSIVFPKGDYSQAEDWTGVFSGCTNLIKIDLSDLDIRGTSFGSAFYQCSSLTELDLTTFNTSNATEMRSMFLGCKNLETLDISSFDTSKVQNFDTMFSLCSNLKTIYASSKFVTTSASSQDQSLFLGCNSLVGGNGTVYDFSHSGLDYARIDKEGAPGYFTDSTITQVSYLAYQGEINGDWAPFWQTYEVQKGSKQRFELNPEDNNYRWDDRYLWWPWNEEMAYKKVLVYADGRRLTPEEIKWELPHTAYMPFTMEIDTTGIKELKVLFFGSDVVKFVEIEQEDKFWFSTYLHGDKSDAYWLTYADILEEDGGKERTAWFFATRRDENYPTPDEGNPLITGVLCVRDDYDTLPDRVEFPSWMNPKYCSYEKISEEEANITFEGLSSQTFEDPIKLIWDTPTSRKGIKHKIKKLIRRKK